MGINYSFCFGGSRVEITNIKAMLEHFLVSFFFIYRVRELNLTNKQKGFLARKLNSGKVSYSPPLIGEIPRVLIN